MSGVGFRAVPPSSNGGYLIHDGFGKLYLVARAVKDLTWSIFLGVCLCSRCGLAQVAELGSVHQTSLTSELKTVKLYGAGRAALDAYQSGFFFSAEGHIATVWSTVLDVADVIAVTSDGRRMQAQVLGIDPNLEIAVLKADQPPPAYFSFDDAADALPGQRVLAFSNLFGIAAGSERLSVQKGVVMTVTPLRARRGNFQSVYQGPALIVDAMTNNPGAAGGALTNLQGQLLGILGKELRDTSANIWINYAIPVSQFKASAISLVEGKSIARVQATRRPADRPTSLSLLGIGLIPNVLNKTPAYVDLVQPSSRAAAAGLQPDDLILFVNSRRVPAQALLFEELGFIDQGDSVSLMIQRGSELKELVIRP
ncbi:MAG: trypsin-like peptidase domain-containing protein [Pirellulaceae bacterium]|nr:trypsin-like peptidase domain-containing protein [Pirellulaceae bacterium]